MVVKLDCWSRSTNFSFSLLFSNLDEKYTRKEVEIINEGYQHPNTLIGKKGGSSSIKISIKHLSNLISKEVAPVLISRC